ncbi:penicillin-binding protein transpeptidase [Spirochaeta thermophila DSM 6578]|uniref:Penicillin-binding protein transpeptidase n=1 Tax=Winmispira thermophila (strain ATCC 700085 / DSM 6578 / Z-1203) TaxID=869211 RepID=G0G9Z5_WINT7|nr:penicillin-binding protein [Spirochaeta thermophila]AEJ61683.1 penicillin-binding protein transpeptidase [Spirochaeta thermophila DSM 6578]
MIGSRLGWRDILVFTLIGIWGVLLVGRYAHLMLSGSPQDSSPSRSIIRGPILDRNGEILAMQTRLAALTAWKPSITRPEEAARLLSPILEMSEEELLSLIQRYPGFFYVKRRISPSEEQEIKNLLEAGSLPGFSLQPEFVRIYPFKQLASHAVGFAGTDSRGLDGIEYTMDRTLMSSPLESPAASGNQVVLTIDVNIQHKTDQIARRIQEEEQADSVMILVADALTGEILAYTALPDFDPNHYPEATDEERFNYPVSAVYEPGSVFKIFSLASIVELGGASRESTFFCNGFYENASVSPPIRIRCLGVHGTETIQDILANSCNAGAAYASDTVDRQRFYEMLTRLGFGSRTGIRLNGESAGVLQPPRLWSLRSKPTIAIGQEIGVTAIQMIQAATALANGGVMLRPRIVKKVLSSDGSVIEEMGPEPAGRVFSPGTAALILEGMREAVERGTARRAALEQLPIAAKTGTAQKVDPETGRYSETAFVASTLALLPADDPRVIVYVVIDTPHGDSYYGGRIAAPVVREIAAFLQDYLPLPSGNRTTLVGTGHVTPLLQRLPEIGDEIPDFTGLSKRDLIPLLLRDDIEVIIRGSGWVTRQDPPPGTPYSPGMRLILELE